MFALGFLVTAAYLPGLFAAAEMPRWWAIAIILPLISRLDPWSLDPFVRWVWLTGLAWAFAMLFISGHPMEGSLDFFFLLLLFGVALAASERDDLTPLMTGLIWGLGISSLLVIPQSMGWHPLPESAAPSGLFFNREVLAEVATPLLVWAMASRRWGLSLICLVPVALCHSRIAVAVSLLCLAVVFLPRRWWVIAGLAVLALIGVVAAFLFFGDQKFESAGYRMVLWGAAWLSITPLGHGLGWWREAHPFAMEEYVHSDWLQFVVELGYLGIAFTLVPALVFWRGRGSVGEKAAFAAICLEALVSFPLHGAAGGFIFAALAGFMARARNPVCAPRSEGRTVFSPDIRRQAA